MKETMTLEELHGHCQTTVRYLFAVMEKLRENGVLTRADMFDILQDDSEFMARIANRHPMESILGPTPSTSIMDRLHGSTGMMLGIANLLIDKGVCTKEEMVEYTNEDNVIKRATAILGEAGFQYQDGGDDLTEALARFGEMLGHGKAATD